MHTYALPHAQVLVQGEGGGKGLVRGRQRDRETERQRDRETERQRDRETYIMYILSNVLVTVEALVAVVSGDNKSRRRS